jgi:hypothetical protein
MKVNIVLALAVAAVAVTADGPVRAGCNPTKEFQLGYGDPTYDLIFPAGADTAIQGGVIGHIWQPGAFATTGDTSIPGNGCVDTYWLYPPSAGGAMTIYGSNGGDLANPDIAGACDTVVCPAGGLVVMVQTKLLDNTDAYYTVGRVSEGSSGAPLFNFALTGSDWNLVPIPKPMVTAVSRIGGTITVNFGFDPPAAAFHTSAADGFPATGTITGYQLVAFTAPTNPPVPDPGREAAHWTNAGAPLPTTAPSGIVSYPCPDNFNVYLANRVIVDGVPTDYVSASQRIQCSFLANPGRPGARPKPIGTTKDVGN